MTLPDPKTALLTAGERLAPRLSLGQLSPEALEAEAGMPAGTLAAEFGDLDGYLVALQGKFMTELRDRVVAAAITQTGPDRLIQGGIAFLERCLEVRPLRSWLLKARRETEAVAQGLQKQDQGYIMILGLELRGLGFNNPPVAAKEFLAMLQQAGKEEHLAGQPLPALRERLWDYLRNPAKAANAA